MKFNDATLYKVPFDNTYKNVVDYHKYTKTGTALIKNQSMTSDDIAECREEYFNSLPKYTAYSSTSNFKSVKVIGNLVECSIALDWTVIKDYNYIVFAHYPAGATSVAAILHCFITNVVSENDSDSPSSKITCEIDYWTQYVSEISLQTPQQFELYAHDNPTKFNARNDARLPNEYIYKNTYDWLYDDAIMFMCIDVDGDHFYDAQMPDPQSNYLYPLDSGTGKIRRIYMPIFAFYKVNDETVMQPIVGVYAGGNYQDMTTVIAKNGYFEYLDSQYVYNVSLTCITPFGLLKKSDHTVVNENKIYLKIDGSITDNNNTFVYMDIDNTIRMYASLQRPTSFYVTNKLNLMGAYNEKAATTFENDFHYNADIDDPYEYTQENKLYSYPFTRKIIIYKGKEYNVTPEPTGDLTTPESKVTFVRFSDVEMRVTNENNIADTVYFSLADNDILPVTVDQYTAYKQTSRNADATKAATTTGAAIATAITIAALAIASGGTTAPLVVGGAIAGGAGTIANTWAQYGATQMQKAELPDNVNAPSVNSMNLLFCIVPVIKNCVLKDEDAFLVTSIWKRYGQPMFALSAYMTRRFWYDYKQFKETSLPSITNANAREKLESIFNKGVTIWHCNSIDDDIKEFTVSNYYHNNPSAYDCIEEV